MFATGTSTHSNGKNWERAQRYFQIWQQQWPELDPSINWYKPQSWRVYSHSLRPKTKGSVSDPPPHPPKAKFLPPALATLIAVHVYQKVWRGLQCPKASWCYVHALNIWMKVARVFLVTTPFCLYQHFWPCGFDVSAYFTKIKTLIFHLKFPCD
jgi:hypothetical protein